MSTIPKRTRDLQLTPNLLTPQQRRDPPVAVTAILACQTHDRGRQRQFISGYDRLVALAGAGLTKNSAGPTLGNTVNLLDMQDAAPAALGAYQFPSAASFKISLSSVRSATARLSRELSCSSSFNRLQMSNL